MARALLPEADAATIKALVINACASESSIASVETAARRAKYLAVRAGRNVPSAEDVRDAMTESVNPSRLQLAAELQQPAAGSRRGKRLAPMSAPLAESEGEPREIPFLRPACGVDADMPQIHRSATAVESFRGGRPAITGRNIRPVEETEDAEITAG